MTNAASWLKCPECHRKSVSLTVHLDGDISLECACGAFESIYPLHESPTVVE